MTTKEKLEELNKLRRAIDMKPLKSWKKSIAELDMAINQLAAKVYFLSNSPTKQGTPIKVVRQFDSWSCHACVAAMITGTTLKEVINFIGHDGSEKIEGSKHPNGHRGFTTAEINLYLAHHKYSIGVFGAKIKGFEPTFYEDYIYLEVQIHINLNLPALIIVESTLTKDMGHSLYFDGKNVYDPYYPDSVELKNYTILEWWPVIKLT